MDRFSWIVIEYCFKLLINFLSFNLSSILQFVTITGFSCIFLSTMDTPDNSIHALIWANLAFIAALIFHAGVTVNRVKSLENRMKDSEDERVGAKLAGLEVGLGDVRGQVDHVRRGIHDLRNLMMGLITKEK